MPEELPGVYWDADVFLSYINGIPARLPDIDALMARSGKDIQLITSSFSIVEVAFGKAEQDGKALDEATERKINALWATNSPIKLVEFHPLIAEGAKELMRKALPLGWKLKPMDAIHLSTARSQNVTEFHTYDQPLQKYAKPGPNNEPAIVGFKIGPPQAAQLSLPGTT